MMRMMRGLRFALVVCGGLAVAGVTSVAQAGPFWCRGPYAATTFAYGNAGFAAGYSTAVTRWGWGGWCGPRWNACGPRWGFSPWAGRTWGWGCAPWYGATRWGYTDSVFLTVPGGGTFFSGGIAPYPVWGYPSTWVPGPCGWYGYPYGTVLPPGFAPQFGPAGVMPFLGLGASTTRPRAGTMVANAAAGPPPVIASGPAPGGRRTLLRASSPAARLRAARLVAVGDRHLREAGGDPARLNAALDAYRRAAAIAQDQTDIQLRQALALVAVGRDAQADEAIGRAVAIDGRLAAVPPRAADGLQAVGADPVFDGQPATGRPPFAVRGAAILREIAGQPGGDEGREVVALLADRWSRRFDRGIGAIAVNPAVPR